MSKGLALTLVLVFLTASCIMVAKPVSGQTPTGNSWVERAPMQVARADLGVAVVDGNIYAIGGRDQSKIYGINEEYNPTTGIWTSKAPMPTPRYSFATAVYEGKIYCMGGIATLDFYLGGLSFSMSTVNEVYDPATNTWTTKAPMTNGSDGYANVVNGKIYVISSGKDPNINLNQVYNPATDSWTTKTPMPNPTGGYNDGLAVLDNKIYVVGSSDLGLTHNLLQIYDPATDTWSVGTPPPVFMGGNIGAVAATTGAYASKRIYVIGVTAEANPYGNATNVNQIYDPATDSWVIGASTPTSRQDFGVAVINDKMYAIGGSVTYYQFPYDNYGVSVIYYVTNELYTPADYGTVTSSPTFATSTPSPTSTNPAQVQSSFPQMAVYVAAAASIIMAIIAVVYVSITKAKKAKANSIIEGQTT